MMKIKNWDKFQHFKDRRPPWVKLYRDILDDKNWFDLSGDDAKLLVMFWLIASENGGEFTSVDDLSFRLRKTEDEIKNALKRLKQWIIQDDIDMISEGYQDDALETERETEKETKKEGEQTAPAPDLEMPDWSNTENAPDPYFKQDKFSATEVVTICELATTIYKSTQYPHLIKNHVQQLLSEVDFNTLKTAIENAAAGGDSDHRYRPNFDKMFSDGQAVIEIAKAPIKAPQIAVESKPIKP